MEELPLRWINPKSTLADVLDADDGDTVVVAIGNWQEMRRMQTRGGEIRFTQQRESGGEWVLTDIFEPEVNNWWAAETHAMSLNLPTPEVAWSGPVENIPADLLASDEPLQVRRINKPGWINLRETVKENSKGIEA